MVFCKERFFHDDFAAVSLKFFFENFSQALGIIGAGIEIEHGGFRVQIFCCELSHDFALLRVDEASAEDERFDISVFDCDVGIGRCRPDDGYAVVRGHLRFGDDVCCDGGAYDGDNFIVGD